MKIQKSNDSSPTSTDKIPKFSKIAYEYIRWKDLQNRVWTIAAEIFDWKDHIGALGAKHNPYKAPAGIHKLGCDKK